MTETCNKSVRRNGNNSDCGRDIFNNKDISDDDKCILHCQKRNAIYNHTEDEKVLEEFYKALIEYIAKSALPQSQTIENTSLVNYETLTNYLINGKGYDEDEVAVFCNDQTIVFDSIFFPYKDDESNSDYVNILKK